MSIEHKSTAKAALREILSIHGHAGTLSLLSEVVLEAVPSRRGRPTRQERVNRLVASSVASFLPSVAALEEVALDAADAAEEDAAG